MPQTRTTYARRAFTLIELLVVIAIIAVLLAILVPTLSGARDASRAGKDATQVRAIVQGLIVFAGQNDNDFPLPSRLDLSNTTIPTSADPTALAIEKDNTGNIYSILPFNGLTNVEQFVSPLEVNDAIVTYAPYAEDGTRSAANPDNALWDPGFAGMPAETGTGLPAGGRVFPDGVNNLDGNTSYAHLPPIGGRRELWTNNSDSRVALVGTRGPHFIRNGSGGHSLTFGVATQGTLRYELLKPKGSWSGNVAYADGRVTLELQANPESNKVDLTDSLGVDAVINDNLFANDSSIETSSSWERLADVENDNMLVIYRNVRSLGSNDDEGSVFGIDTQNEAASIFGDPRGFDETQ
ncbi:MAG: type II secretion system protein [Planctomycetota bacterium]